jgi:hypothetical protein
VLLKHRAHSLKVEFSRQIHNGAIFVIERPDRSRLRLVAIREVGEKVDLGFDVALEIHAHKGGKLHKSRVDAPQGAGIAQRHDTDQLALEPPDGSPSCQPIDLGRVDPVSIGPAINVILRGCAGSVSSAIIATAATTATQGWHTPITWVPGPSTWKK